jgi:hypothetical protein
MKHKSWIVITFLGIHLTGEGGNTQGLGAKLKIFHNGHIQFLEQNPARGYLSNSSSTLHFGLGKDQKVDSLAITWISGKVQRLYNIKSNQVLDLVEKNATDKPLLSKLPVKWFTEITPAIKYESPDTNINDFNRQALLISEFSYSSPCMRKYDLNNDGLEDVLIGGAARQATSIFIQQKNGTFSEKKISAFENDKAFVDADIAVFDANSDGHQDIYIASGGYHGFNESDTLLNDRLYLNNGKNDFLKSKVLPEVKGSKSCARVDDINGDGFRIFLLRKSGAGSLPGSTAVLYIDQ